MFRKGDVVILVEMPPMCDGHIHLGDRFIVDRVVQDAGRGTKIYVTGDLWFRPERFRLASNQGDD